ncbi:AAA domain-containing protein [Maritimibacter dapengensis]|uniref:AAA family ATPase n=1 Tax=Maritimibacter dapengensis TaxID=2836868 RepID=A0ABS6T5T4_9RHOB|nr:AAA domain-containing protein [Maritimibacter dapengensis]MBV7380590.1 AAA family ATPase [Maritimibacter dapengensis]
MAALAEIDQLIRDGKIRKDRTGRLLAHFGSLSIGSSKAEASTTIDGEENSILTAAPALFSQIDDPSEELAVEEKDTTNIDLGAVLRYWRSALRADPRGATTQVEDKHGIEWTLISGAGPIVPGEGATVQIRLSLSGLPATFQEALVRREGNENALAVGWPLSVARQRGVPIVRPIGLLAASWERQGDDLILSLHADDVLVNPEWVQQAARASGWNRNDLADVFHSDDGVGLPAIEFLDKLKVAVASQIKGRINGEDLVSSLNLNSQGIFDAAAVFLPTDSSFVAGAARNLDEIASWSEDRIAQTALGAALGMQAEVKPAAAAIDAGPLNQEQLRAVRGACEAPLTVVTGPPGTGKSQAIVSMAASVLAAGGSVLVASKNHQALDAVEDRLGSLSSNTSFMVRTLNPNAEIDVGFADVLKALIDNENSSLSSDVDELALARLVDLARRRAQSLDQMERVAEIECALTDILERIALRTDAAGGRQEQTGSDEAVQVDKVAMLVRLLRWFHAVTSRRPASIAEDVDDARPGSDLIGLSLSDLKARLSDLRDELAELGKPEDPITLGSDIQEIIRSLLPKILSKRGFVAETRRREVAEVSDDWQFAGGRGLPPEELSQAVVEHRPLWLASVLGAPKRIPLHDGLFDLVIFDEASQCDIATAMPLFARAKRAVVVGDDLQLSFIPQLSQAQDRNLMQAQGLPIARMGRFAQSRRSLFDFASRAPCAERITLRHQYRSAGPIVDYISSTFYGGVLETSYDPDRLVMPKGAKPGLAWEDVPAPAVSAGGNVNTAEVATILRHLKKLLVDEGYEGSIGVVTPFRAQVLELENAINREIPETKRIAAELKVGTVDGFQGQERDLILFSPVVGPRSPQSGMTFFQRDKRRLNVAISRARAVAMVFGDLNFARSGKSTSLQRLAAYATEQRGRSGEGVFDSDWERKVYHALKARGLNPEPQFEIAGRRLDFALFGAGGIKLDLEVDGRKWHQTPDGRRKTQDLWRDEQLKAMGWRVRRFWVDELAKDMEGCLDRVEQDLS